ncbi:hypothetical protein BH23CHL8_BH23CHL8_00700 [soil metagenome]
MIGWLARVFQHRQHESDPAFESAAQEDLRVLRKAADVLPDDEGIRGYLRRAEAIRRERDLRSRS